MPTPILFAAWGCFFVAMAGLIYGTGMADWLIACLVLTAGLLIQVQMRIVWCISMSLLLISLLYLLGLAITGVREQAAWFELSVILLLNLLTTIIIGLLLLPIARAYYREEPEHNG